VIPEAAVEAGARALAARNRRPEEWQWYLSEARSALEAAAPHLMAEAWDEGNIAGIFDLPSEDHATPNPYRSGFGD
jgi:hypothetical protein